MRIYIIGPVTGVDDLNKPAFDAARRELAAAGFTALVPHDYIAADADWQQAMRRSIETLVKADGITHLPGWEASHGARLETEIAERLGIPAATVEEWIDGETLMGIMRDAKNTKQCPSCKRVIPLTLFNHSAVAYDMRQARCRECMGAYRKERIKK